MQLSLSHGSQLQTKTRNGIACGAATLADPMGGVAQQRSPAPSVRMLFAFMSYAKTSFAPHLNAKSPTRCVGLLCGLDGTRTRDPMRDRHVF